MQPNGTNQHSSIAPDAKARHEKSKRKYPELNLSANEYVIVSVRRHPVGLIYIWLAEVVVIILVVLVLGLAIFSPSLLTNTLGTSVSFRDLAFVSLLLIVLMLAIGMVSTSIYRDNRFYLTNESIIEHVRIGLLNRREKTISLGSVEDVSFSQQGILQYAFNYGSVRLATVGDETSYRFTNVAKPRTQAAVLNQAVEDFKNHRPVETSQHSGLSV